MVKKMEKGGSPGPMSRPKPGDLNESMGRMITIVQQKGPKPRPKNVPKPKSKKEKSLFGADPESKLPLGVSMKNFLRSLEKSDPNKFKGASKIADMVFKKEGGKVDLKKETGRSISNADKARLQKSLEKKMSNTYSNKTGRTISDADIALALEALSKTNKGGVTNRPKLMKKGGAAFPDLTGDGKVTKKDILRGRGVPGFKRGGAASNVCRGGGAALRGTRFRGVK